MNRDEMKKMFEDADVTFDDMHKYIEEKYELDNYDSFSKEDIEGVVNRIKEWKDAQ